jgi:5-hydroxyisourate hydrolase-like protein (transthyretin family)
MAGSGRALGALCHRRRVAGMRVDLLALEGGRRLAKSVITNGNGRTDEPVLADASAGVFELLFHVGPYFRQAGLGVAGVPFLDEVPVRFAIAEAQGRYHVPLLVSPWSYTIYRGR